MDFSKLKIVELASVLAGPAVGMFFAEMGAHVTKIENKNAGGDVTRQWKNSAEPSDSSISAYFCTVNWGKEHLFLDLKDENDYEQLISLIASTDIVVANYPGGSAAKLRVDYDTLKVHNPKLIYGNISGYGEDSSRPAYDVVLQAESGFMFMNGTPEISPLKIPLAFIDILAAHQLKEGLLTALLQQEKDGKGKHVTVSLYDTAIASLYNQSTNWLMSGFIPQPIGSLHPNISPYGEVVYCKDNRSIVLAVGSDRQFLTLCRMIDRSELAEDERFCNNHQRVLNRAILLELLQQEFTDLDIHEILPALIEGGVPCGAVNDMKEVFENEEANKLLLEEKMDGENTTRVRTSVFNIS